MKIILEMLSYPFLVRALVVGVLVSLWNKFNISVFLLEATWVAISIYGIARTLRKGTQASA